MEYFPASSQQQFQYIKRIIDRCDYYVLLIAGMYGSLSTSGLSFTEEEYRYAVSKGIPVLAFLHGDLRAMPSAKVETDPERFQLLSDFRDQVSENRIVDFWTDARELPGKVAIAVTQEINVNPGRGWVRGDTQISPEVVHELASLRNENSRLKSALSQIESRPDTATSSIDRTLQLEYEPGTLLNSIGLNYGSNNALPKRQFSISIKSILEKINTELIAQRPTITIDKIIPGYDHGISSGKTKHRLTRESKEKLMFSLKAMNIVDGTIDHNGDIKNIILLEEGRKILLDIFSPQ